MSNPIKSIRMSDELYEDMRLYCSVMNITMADFIRDAVDEHICNSIESDGFQQRAEELFKKDQGTLDRLLQRKIKT